MPDHKTKRLTREDFVHALNEIGSYIDVSVEDLMDITSRAERHAQLRLKETVKVETIMNRPVDSVRRDTSLAQAAHLLVERRISGLPVVDEENRLVGIITEADFLRAIGVPAHHPTHNLWQTLESMFTHTAAIREPEGEVSDLMVTDVITARPDQTVHDVVEKMKKHRIKRIVVVDDQHQPVGMVTRSDLVRVFFDRFKTQAEAS